MGRAVADAGGVRSSVAGRGVGSKTAGSWAWIIAHPTASAQPAKGSNNRILSILIPSSRGGTVLYLAPLKVNHQD
jgi:hypothetical protein